MKTYRVELDGTAVLSYDPPLPPASPEAIARLNAAAGPLPGDYLEFLARHDGFHGETEGADDERYPISLYGVREAFKGRSDYDAAEPGLLAIGIDGNGCVYVLRPLGAGRWEYAHEDPMCLGNPTLNRADSLAGLVAVMAAYLRD